MKPKCAIIGRECPETADPTKPWYCPHWVDAIPEVEKDGSGGVIAEHIYRGCFLRRMPLYLLSVAKDAGQAAASADGARNKAVEARSECATLGAGIRALVQIGSRTAGLVSDQGARARSPLLPRPEGEP